MAIIRNAQGPGRSTRPATRRSSRMASATCSLSQRTSRSATGVGPGDRHHRRPAARRAGDQRPLCAERRQRPLGQPVRRAVRHRRHPRRAAAGARRQATIPMRGARVIAKAAGIPGQGRAARQRVDRRRRTAYVVEDGTGWCCHNGRRCAQRASRPGAVRRLSGDAGTRPPSCCQQRPAHRDRDRPRTPHRQDRPGRRRRRRAGSGDHHDLDWRTSVAAVDAEDKVGDLSQLARPDEGHARPRPSTRAARRSTRRLNAGPRSTPRRMAAR